MRRIIPAQTAKKWARFCQRTFFQSIKRDVGLVDQGRSLQGVAGTLPGYVSPGHRSKFAVDDGRHLPQCILIAAGPSLKQSRYLIRRGLHRQPRGNEIVLHGSQTGDVAPLRKNWVNLMEEGGWKQPNSDTDCAPSLDIFPKN